MKPFPPGYGEHHFGATKVVISSHGTRTVFPDGNVLASWPSRDGASLLQALSAGYHGNVDAMCRERHYLHAKLCHALGLPQSPALARLVRCEPPTDLTRAEEDLILAAARFLNLYRNEDRT